MRGGAATVVSVEVSGEVAVVEAILVQRHGQRQAGTDIAGVRRPADAHARDRNHAGGQRQEIADLGRMIADHADRAAAEPDGFGRDREGRKRQRGIDRRVEEQVEMIVRKRLAALLGDVGQAPAVGQEDQEYRRLAYPRHVGDEIRDRAPFGRLANDQDIALLQIALRRRRKRASTEQIDQVAIHRARRIAPDGAVIREPGKSVEARHRRIDGETFAEALGERGLDRFDVGGTCFRGMAHRDGPRHGGMA
jgi:hypothetical protein